MMKRLRQNQPPVFCSASSSFFLIQANDTHLYTFGFVWRLRLEKTPFSCHVWVDAMVVFMLCCMYVYIHASCEFRLCVCQCVIYAMLMCMRLFTSGLCHAYAHTYIYVVFMS